MARKSRYKPFKIAGCMDTETCNYRTADGWTAWPILYICNDLTECDILDYVADESPERITFYRDHAACELWFESLIQKGTAGGYIPVVCFYNMMFDLCSLRVWISDAFAEVNVCAQSSTNAYYIDLRRGGQTVMRLWDTFHLEMSGLKGMGRVCGLAKAVGDWDYSLVRTPETPLTEEELFYARRDVQVVPAYLRYTLEANPHLAPADLGNKLLTKTGLARVMAGKLFHNSTTCPDGKKRNPRLMYAKRANEEKPKTYRRYSLRKACFQGGFTFTAGRAAFRVWHDVVSFDAVSMHHTFTNGRYLPVDFRFCRPSNLQSALEMVARRPLSQVLERYHCPFPVAFHAQVAFKNVRLKKGSLFESMQIGLVAETKFYLRPPASDEHPNQLNQIADELSRHTMRNRATGARFAFSKLLSADECILHMNELELWTFAQVYDFDSMCALFGEATSTFRPPESQATLLSNILFSQKQAMKGIDTNYEQGKPYTRDIPEIIPRAIAASVQDGTASGQFIHAYYTSTVKGLFNSAGYGVHAQDEYKPDFVWSDGIAADRSTALTEVNFTERVTDSEAKVLYNLGMRIVGGSRMHLVIAMILCHETGAVILDGDTDSMKIALNGRTVADIEEALEPLHRATAEAIDTAQYYVRKDWPQYAGSLAKIGSFECENPEEPYADYFCAWNKARIYRNSRGLHIVMAGVSRPEGRDNVETWAADWMAQGHTFAETAELVFGFNNEIDASVSNSLEKRQPDYGERVDLDVTDYLGKTSHVDAFAAVALYESARDVNDASKNMNHQNLCFLRAEGLDPDIDTKVLSMDSEHRATVRRY